MGGRSRLRLGKGFAPRAGVAEPEADGPEGDDALVVGGGQAEQEPAGAASDFMAVPSTSPAFFECEISAT